MRNLDKSALSFTFFKKDGYILEVVGSRESYDIIEELFHLKND